MDTAFWIERWDRKQIGFHQTEINPYLQAHWASLGVTGGTVLVPLCGKSLDMRWLHAQGHAVIGVEVSRQAVSEFFAEQQLEPHVTQGSRFESWQAPGYRLLCGDFFALEAADLYEVGAVFDRAALIALPQVLRQRYVDKLQATLPAQVHTLLVAMTYPQQQMNGPPFSVDETAVRSLYGSYKVEKLQDEDILIQPENARFKERGLRQMSEQVYRLSAGNL
jgi:thiopurine S-methyltransferase